MGANEKGGMTRENEPGAREDEQRNLAVRIGPLEVAWPRAIGYYGALALAVSFGVVEPPLAIFVGLVPVFKMFKRPNASQIQWAAGEVLQGASQPVAGSGEPVIRVHEAAGARRGAGALDVLRPITAIWTDARERASR